jgi:hypothetical protein
MANVPWHYTTVVDFLDHWQTLITGVLAVIAAGVTLFVTLRIERRRVERELAAVIKNISVSLSPRKIDQTETYDCFIVTATNDGQRAVDVQQFAIQVSVGRQTFLIAAEPEGGPRIRPPHRLEPTQGISATVDIMKICTELVEREIKGDVSLLGICSDNRGAEFRSAIWPTTVEDLIDHAKS